VINVVVIGNLGITDIVTGTRISINVEARRGTPGHPVAPEAPGARNVSPSQECPV